MSRDFSIKQIAELVSGEIIGNAEKSVSKVAILDDATENQISFLAHTKYKKVALHSKAGAILTKEKIETDSTQILVKDPYLALVKVMGLFFKESFVPRIAPSAQINPTSRIDENVIIGENVVIGARCKIAANTVIFPNATICPNTIIGENCRIHSGTVIGSDGFGFVASEESITKIPQVGRVKIGNFVEIGANCTVNCGTLGDTVISDFVKLDSQVHVGHNVKIGKGTLIAAQTGISGSVEIGNFVQIGGQVGIDGHLKIGNYSKVGGKSGVTKNVSEGEIVFGYPAKEIHFAKKMEAILRKLVKNEFKHD